jgi:hypothetical protein
LSSQSANKPIVRPWLIDRRLGRIDTGCIELCARYSYAHAPLIRTLHLYARSTYTHAPLIRTLHLYARSTYTHAPLIRTLHLYGAAGGNPIRFSPRSPLRFPTASSRPPATPLRLHILYARGQETHPRRIFCWYNCWYVSKLTIAIMKHINMLRSRCGS